MTQTKFQFIRCIRPFIIHTFRLASIVHEKNFESGQTLAICRYRLGKVKHLALIVASFFLFLFGYMSHILRTSTEHKTTSLADEGNSAYCQSSGAHNIKHI